MARTQSEKHNLLECAKPSNSTPSPTLNQLPGRSQARAGDFPSVEGTSGAASMERLPTSLGCSFDGSLRDTPATITSEVADTGVGSGVEEHREKPLVPPRQGAIATSTDCGAQAGQEEFRAAFLKSTSKSEPRLDPEAHPMTASDESDEIRTRSRKEREDAFPHNVTADPGSQTWVIVAPMKHSQHGSVYKPPHAINCVRPPDDTRNVHTSDGEHAGCCIVCGFKLPWPRQLRCGGD
ncbi:hypothetical protein EDD15DRAFT_1615062 [Pisolithus albus]|nr:hypothetical protein EDD15DRAFT_1615062 [Pisolithus albus]